MAENMEVSIKIGRLFIKKINFPEKWKNLIRKNLILDSKIVGENSNFALPNNWYSGRNSERFNSICWHQI